MTRLLHMMNYRPLGTRAFDHFIVEFARQTRERGWEMVFGFVAEPPPAFAAELQDVGASWVVYRSPLTWFSSWRLQQAVRHRKPDVLVTSFHSVFEPPLIWYRLCGFTKRLIVLDHASGTGPSPHSPLTFLRRLRGRVIGRIVDAVCCVSAYNAKRNIERVFLPAEKISVVENGIDLARFPFSERMNESPLQVAFAGQLIPQKGVMTLLKAVERLKGSAFDVSIAGKGPQREALERFARDRGLDNVKFLGHVDDVPALFSRAHIVVVPSEWAEAFGLVVIEAMACGAVVVASDAGALPEVIDDSGVLFRTGDDADLAAKLQPLFSDEPDRRRLAVKARRHVEEHYTLHDCVRRRLDVVSEIL